MTNLHRLNLEGNFGSLGLLTLLYNPVYITGQGDL